MRDSGKFCCIGLWFEAVLLPTAQLGRGSCEWGKGRICTMTLNKVFFCDKCGLCCRSLNNSQLYDDLNDGTGTCIYYDKATKLCSIYENRPEKCNVEKMYKYFPCDVTWEEYVKFNLECCKNLKGRK